jgi:YVTN family beta-propeller protein
MRYLWVVFLGLVSSNIHAGQSSSLIDISPNGKSLLVANTDSDSVTLVDPITRKKIKEIPVGDHPEGVAWIGEGPLAIVTLYRENKIAFVDTEAGKVLTKLDAVEPYGVVTTQDGKRAYVSLDYPGTVCEIDVESRKIVRQIKVGAWCRGIGIGNDEKRLYVSNFFTADLYGVDIASGKVIETWEGNGEDNLCRSVTLNPKRDKAYLSHIRSRVKIFDADGSIVPYLSMCDLFEAKDKTEKRRRAMKMDTFNGVYVVANTWEVAVTPDAKKLFVIYAATNDMNVCPIVDDDYREIDRIGLPRDVGNHPRAVRVSPDGKTLFVYATMDFRLEVFNIADMKRLDPIPVCNPPHTPEWVRGKILFQTSNRPMTSRRWVACSSCHPDGAHDNRTWHNPEGLRKTPPMFGLAHTHPLHWSADRDEVQDFEYTIRGKLMRGRGLASDTKLKPRSDFLPASELDQTCSGLSKDLDALAIYTNSFPVRLSPHIPSPGKLSEEAIRGKELFFSKEVNCASCHSGPYYTDSRLQKPYNLHDVGTGDGKDEKMGPKYDTPSLIGVYRSAPYLHHGKAETLMDVLTKYNPQDKHGKTSHLSTKQKEDLVAFLKSLPYETPPDETPNTVPHREIKARKE